MDPRPEVRVGDSERRETDERLRVAHGEGRLTLTEYDERSERCFAARFRHELDELVADLPDTGPTTSSPAVAPETAPVTAPGTTAAGLRERAGGWGRGLVGVAIAGVLAFTVLGADQGAAVFGSHTVTVGPGQTEAEVGVLFGSTKVVVPDGVRATTSGLTVFGSTECATACTAGTTGGPQVNVSARGAFGSVEVLTATEAATGVDLRGDRDDREDRDDD